MYAISYNISQLILDDHQKDMNLSNLLNIYSLKKSQEYKYSHEIILR